MSGSDQIDDAGHPVPPHWPPDRCPWDDRSPLAPCSLVLDCGGRCGLEGEHAPPCVCAGLLGDSLGYR